MTTVERTLALAAAGGLVSGLAGCDDKAPAGKTEATASASPAAASASAAAAGDKSCCAGKNECKGKGGCRTSANECQGKNECKGKGGCNMRDCP